MAANPSMAGTLGLKAVDSNEVRKKQVGFTHSINEVRGSPSSEASTGSPIYNNPTKLDDVFFTPTKFKPFKPLDLYPQHQKSSVIQTQSPSNLGSLPSGDLEGPTKTSTPHSNTIPDLVRNPSIKNPNSTNSTPISIDSISTNLVGGSDLNPVPHTPPNSFDTHHISTSSQSKSTSPARSGPSLARKLQDIFQREGDKQACEDRISSLVQSIEDEMHNTGINVNLSQLKSHILQVCDDISNPEVASSSANVNFVGDFVETECNSPRHMSKAEPNNSRKTDNTKKWASLFQAQAPSKSMKLEHYPEMQQGKDAVVELDDTDVDTNSWDNCLVGYFLDGRMPYNLLCATARSVWKENAPKSIKQIGACFFFEFRDEVAKLQILEGGPYFFSRRYLALTDWKRMLVPTTKHPPSIPAWVKLHKLPLECWTATAFSHIASSIGRPIHVDEATAGKKRLDFARICVEISAGDELPSEVVVKSNGESIAIRVEYQWLPPKCSECKVFGHKCPPKAAPAPVAPDETWQTVGKQINISNKDPFIQHQVKLALEKGGSNALDVVTNEIESTTPLRKSGETLTPTVPGVGLLEIVDTEEVDDSSEELEEIVADVCPTNEGIKALKGQLSSITKQLNNPAALSSVATSSSPPLCPQSAGSNTKRNKNKKKGSNGRSGSTKGH